MIHGEGGGLRLSEIPARSGLAEGLPVSLTNIRGYGIYSNYGYWPILGAPIVKPSAFYDRVAIIGYFVDIHAL